MKNQTPTVCLAIIPYYNQSINPLYINTHPPNPNNTPRISPSFFRKICYSLTEELHRHYTTEQLITVTFLQIMTITSISHLRLGFELLEKKVVSESPIVMSIFKYSLTIFTIISIVSVDFYRQLFKAPVLKTTHIFGMSLVLPIAYFLSPATENYRRISIYIIGKSYKAYIEFLSTGLGRRGWLVKSGVYLFMKTIAFPVGVGVKISSNFLIVVLFFTISTFAEAARSNLDTLISYAPSLQCYLNKSVQRLLPLATARVKSALNKKKKIWKLVKFAFGLVGTLIFQNFFRLTTFGHVKAFMYLATSWLASLTLINASDDCGILNFLLGNMILGSTVSQYGLHITTWFTYGICLFLYILGVKLKSMNMASQSIENLKRPPFLFWIFYCCVVFDSLYNLFH